MAVVPIVRSVVSVVVVISPVFMAVMVWRVDEAHMPSDDRGAEAGSAHSTGEHVGAANGALVPSVEFLSSHV